ncbi:hypothetical protein ABIB25_005162 [Nakamurella sp. UYEF19]|uniref:hypothetical protein n=1 Tax=Nakamurella sp. UYEF19 TaxID=1756392 RepID=UPI0033991378
MQVSSVKAMETAPTKVVVSLQENMLDYSCQAEQPLSQSIGAALTADKEASLVVGKAKPTGQTFLGDAPEGSSIRTVYTELSIQVETVLSGQQLSSVNLLAYVPGGTFQNEYRTLTNGSASSSWATDGTFLGLIYKDAVFPTDGFALASLPVVNGSIVFAPTGCFSSIGVASVSSNSFVVLKNGLGETTSLKTKVLKVSDLVAELK